MIKAIKTTITKYFHNYLATVIITCKNVNYLGAGLLFILLSQPQVQTLLGKSHKVRIFRLKKEMKAIVSQLQIFIKTSKLMRMKTYQSKQSSCKYMGRKSISSA